MKARKLLVGADFDGTLSMIAPRPHLARILPRAKRALARLRGSRRAAVAIVSGRSLPELKRLVGVPGLIYAGNHGLEIEGPWGLWVHPGARRLESRAAELVARLRAAFGRRPGYVLQDKRWSATLHYRLVKGVSAGRIRRRLEGLGMNGEGFKLFEGKKVWEIRPDVDWHKGRALEFIRDRTGAGPVLFLGDDQTDEDAFRRLGARDLGVRVGPGRTAAVARVKDPRAAAGLLERLYEVLEKGAESRSAVRSVMSRDAHR